MALKCDLNALECMFNENMLNEELVWFKEKSENATKATSDLDPTVYHWIY